MLTMSFLRAVGLASIWLLPGAIAQLPTDSTAGITLVSGSSALSTTERRTPTGTYQSFSSKISLGTSSSSSSVTIAPNATTTDSRSTRSSTTDSLTLISGSPKSSSTTMSGNFSTTPSASPSASPVNSRPCNNYPEFCNRKYSNITMVAAHNSPFVRTGSAAANQQYTVKTQLDDGVRFLQAQIQFSANDTVPHFCHTSCDILDAGPITDWLTQVREWIEDSNNRYEVVTILLGNGNYSQPDKYAPYIEQTGLTNYVYTPPVVPMNLTDWPTLGEMIISNKRVVMFLDYNANQTAYPWLQDEFSQLWETPFDPVDQTFPCTVQRPPDLPADQAKARMYMTNHNLNVEISVLGSSLLVPAVSVLNQTNNVTGTGSLGLAAENCRTEWGRRPTS